MVISAYFSLDFPKNIGKKSEEMEKKKKNKEKNWNKKGKKQERKDMELLQVDTGCLTK